MERKIIYLNEKPFELTLPTGGTMPHDNSVRNDWDSVLSSGCYFNYEKGLMVIGSWCIDRPLLSRKDRVVRGRGTSRNWGYAFETTQAMNIGFRPVLLPLDDKTLEFYPSLLSYMNGSIIKMGNFVVNNTVLCPPFGHVYQVGDVVDLRDDIQNRNKGIEWAVMDGKLICVDNLMVNVSYEQLIRLGLLPDRVERIENPVVDKSIAGQYLGLKYVLVTVPSLLTFEEQKRAEKQGKDRFDWFTVLAVKLSYLLDYVHKETSFDSLRDYFEKRDYKEEVFLENLARNEDALAFIYRPMSDNKLILSNNMDGEKLWVLTEFLYKYLYDKN